MRGIPNVKGFVDGELVDEFTGALPESGVRGFIERLVPSASEKLRRAAAAAVARGEPVRCGSGAARGDSPSTPATPTARVDLAALLVARNDYAGAEVQLALVPEEQRDERAAAIAAKVALWRRGQSLPDLSTLKAALDAHPEDLDARLGYAERLAAEGRFRAALDELIEVVRRDRGEWRERARKTVVALFGVAADQPDLVGEYRRKLAGALY